MKKRDGLLKQADALLRDRGPDTSREIAEAERVLKISEVARMARVSVRTVWRDIDSGLLAVERRTSGKRNRNRVKISVARTYAMTK